MIKLQEAGQAVAANKFLSAIQNATSSLLAVIMVGAICVVLNTVLGPNMLGLIQSSTPISSFFTIPYSFTMNMLGLWTVMLLAYNYERNLKLKNKRFFSLSFGNFNLFWVVNKVFSDNLQ